MSSQLAALEQPQQQEEEGGQKGAFWILSRRQWASVGVLTLANLFTACAFSCIVPFFPTEARRKGLSTGQVGVVIGAFQLAVFCACPLLGIFIDQIGPRRMFSGGLALSGVSVMLYALLKLSPSAEAFYFAALAMRCTTAVGNSAFRTSSLTLIAKTFPTHVSSVVGLSQTIRSVGYTIGPTIGSALYQLGGFSLPFFALGSLISSSAVVSVLVARKRRGARTWLTPLIIRWETIGKDPPVPATDEEETCLLGKKRKRGCGLLAVLRIPEVRLSLLIVFALELSLFFYDASLAEHLTQLVPDSALLTGLMLSLSALLSMTSAPFWGVLIDYFRCVRPILLAGTALAAAFPLLMGPTPLLPYLQLSVSTTTAAFVLQGLAITAIHTPIFKFCIEGARRRGYDGSSTSICGCISGLLNGAIALGAFVGVTLGGWSAEWIGFEWTGTLVGIINLVPLTGQLCFHVSQL